MTTRIFDLPTYIVTMTVGTNEDWRDSWPYVDASGAPLSLAGIGLDFVLASLATGGLAVVASTGTQVGGLPTNGRVASGGVAGNVAGLNIPRATMLGVIPGSYAHEMQARADGVTRTIARGIVTLVKGYAG